MSEHTDPIWSLIIWACLTTFILCALAYVISDRIVATLAWIDRDNAETDAQAAADHNEPTREQIEWELHLADAIRLAREDDLAWQSWDELEFAASVHADIDDLPGGDAA